MTIQPPSFSIFPTSLSSLNPLAGQYKRLWDNWWADSTKETADILLQFIIDPDHKKVFEELARNAVPPYAGAIFAHDYNTAVKQLSDWIEAGCNPDTKSAVSEFLKYVYQWIDQ